MKYRGAKIGIIIVLSIFLILLLLLLIYACSEEKTDVKKLHNAYDEYCDENCQKYVAYYTGKPSWRVSYFIGLIIAGIMTMLIGVIRLFANKNCGFDNFAIELILIFILITLVSFTTVYKTIGWMNFHMVGSSSPDAWLNFKINEIKNRK